MEFPSIGQPGGEITVGRGWQVGEQLGEIELRVDIVPLAGRRQAGEDSCRATTAGIAHKEAVLAI